MIWSRRKRRERQRLQHEIEATLTRIRNAAESGARELSLCGVLLSIKSEQLGAAEAIGDEETARQLMDEMRPLIAERDRLIARERAFNDQLEKQLAQIQQVTKER